MRNACVFIDGNNFYFKLKELSSQLSGKYSLTEFGYTKFCEWLIGPNKLSGVRYYIGSIKRQRGNRRSEQMYASQQKLVGKLQQQSIKVVLGHIIRHPDKSYHEKGVDVRIAVEMIRLARRNEFDIVYLLSSDTDLVPAVEEVRSMGKTVQYVGIASGQSFGLTKAADNTTLLRPEDIEPFLMKSLV